jgi:protein required for attachment to host cells
MEDGGATWIIVADGGQARLFEDRRRACDLVETDAWRMVPVTSDHLHGRPHRATVHGRTGGARHVGEEVSLQDEAEDRFLKRVATELARAEVVHAFDGPALLAPSRASGRLRQERTPVVGCGLQASGPHDCVREAPERVRQRLRDVHAAPWRAQ